MQDLGPLFQDRDPGVGDAGIREDRTFGVLALNEAISGALTREFPGDTWVRGEIQGLARTRMRQHWYFELVEKDPGSDRVLAKVSVALLNWNRRGVERDMRAAPGFDLEDDLEVRIRCEVGYYAPFGKLQLVMKGIDPSFTLGQMAVNRERILRSLAQEGLLERNGRRELPVVPQRIGLVTSLGSAAYNDFVHEIQRAELGLSIVACDARVQGAQTEETVLAALRTLQHEGCDLIVLVRGGGSRSDLAGFDTESIARAIAVCEVPVWTGIGHEIDRSVADEVAHTAFKTPTAAAGAIVARTHEFLDRIEGDWEAIEATARAVLTREQQRLLQATREAARGAQTSYERRNSLLGRRSREVVHGARLRLVEAEGQLAARAAALSPARFGRSLERRDQRLLALRSRLGQLAQRGLRDLERRLQSVEARVRANDPGRLLRRGYSLSYDSQGRLLRQAKGLAPGDLVRTRLGRGEILGRVESTAESPESTTSGSSEE